MGVSQRLDMILKVFSSLEDSVILYDPVVSNANSLEKEEKNCTRMDCALTYTDNLLDFSALVP